MRVLKNILLTALLTCILSSLNANTEPGTLTARKEIKTWIQKADLTAELKENVTIHVTFMINNKNEIIIQSTSKENFEHRIKAALNHKKLDSTDMKPNIKYTLPIILKKI